MDNPYVTLVCGTKKDGRESQALLDVESQRAKRRQLATLKQNVSPSVSSSAPLEPYPAPASVGVTLPPRETGKARDKVGAQLGVSGSKAERAAAVVHRSTITRDIEALLAEMHQGVPCPMCGHANHDWQRRGSDGL